MKRRACVLLLAMIVLVGCPDPSTGKYRFTSADLSNRWYWALDTPGAGDNLEESAREVVEPDVIHRDGALLYLLNQYRGLTLVDLDTDTILTRVPTFGYPRDLYVDGTRAYVLVSEAADYTADGNTVSFSVAARLYVVDVTTPAEAEIIGMFDLPGDLVDSRLVGDVLYAVCAEYSYSVVDTEVVRTKTSASWVTSVNVADPGSIQVVDELSFGGLGDVIHVTTDAIHVAASEWGSDTTRLTYVDISDPGGLMAMRGNVDITGDVADRFKMDEWNGVLRVVSSTWQGGRHVYVTTVDLSDPDNLAVMAETEIAGADGETLFATRFDGPRAYVVTYFVVDPLFVLDLSDPYAPAVAGELEVPGWSVYIEPRGDRLLALGVDDTGGQREICVSLFNVEDPENPGLEDRLSFGEGWAWSSAYEDVKAFSVFDDVLIVPFSGWRADFGGYDRLQFISHSLDDLTLGGTVDIEGAVMRSLDYDGSYYSLSTEQLLKIDASDLQSPVVANRIQIAENLVDFLEIAPGLSAEILHNMDSGITTVRTVAAAKLTGELEVPLSEFIGAHVYGERIVLVGAMWGETANTRVAVVDCSTGQPELEASRDLDVTPYYGWMCPWYYVDGGIRNKYLLPWPYPSSYGDVTFLLGDMLAIRCWSETWDSVVGPDRPNEGIAVISLPDLTADTTIGLGYDSVVSVDATGDKLYIGSIEDAGIDLQAMQPVAAYFLTELDPATGVAGARVNVPGTFVQYDAADDLLVLHDLQWIIDGWNVETRNSLRTVSWDGAGDVEPIDQLALPDGIGNLVGAGPQMYFDVSDSGGTRLGAVTLSAAGDLADAGRVLVTKQYASLLDGHATAAYLRVGPGAIARYTFTGGPQLTDLVPAIGYPNTIRFGATQAYAVVGYFGLVVVPL